MNVTPPRLSVIIPAHNAASVLGEQLEALRVQEGADPFEVLVCDNNSTDSTAQLALDEARSLDLRVVDASGPASASHARNRGAVAAAGEILLFCDADDLVDPHWVVELSAPLSRGADVLVAGALHHQRFNDADVLRAYDIGPDPDRASVPEESSTPPPYADTSPRFPATASPSDETAISRCTGWITRTRAGRRKRTSHGVHSLPACASSCAPAPSCTIG